MGMECQEGPGGCTAPGPFCYLMISGDNQIMNSKDSTAVRNPASFQFIRTPLG